MRKIPKLELEDVKTILTASESESQKIGIDMDIAVVDDGGNLLGFHRMDRAKITGIDIAINKAFTAAGTRKPTRDYKPVGAPDGPAFGIHVSNQGRFMIFGGGVPIMVEGECIGAVGCSSGSPEQDEQVAQAGIDAFLKHARKKK
ncbi:MAG: DNA polymerase III subunit delta' [Acidobacteria bacterium]|nr:MAG: DNA polymerase III subunit delta' [Acidobacteriota bacterium]